MYVYMYVYMNVYMFSWSLVFVVLLTDVFSFDFVIVVQFETAHNEVLCELEDARLRLEQANRARRYASSSSSFHHIELINLSVYSFLVSFLSRSLSHTIHIYMLTQTQTQKR